MSSDVFQTLLPIYLVPEQLTGHELTRINDLNRHELKWKNSTNVSFDVEDLPHYLWVSACTTTFTSKTRWVKRCNYQSFWSLKNWIFQSSFFQKQSSLTETLLRFHWSFCWQIFIISCVKRLGLRVEVKKTPGLRWSMRLYHFLIKKCRIIEQKELRSRRNHFCTILKKGE